MTSPASLHETPDRTMAASPVYGWSLVGILLIAYALSFIDRQILSLLVNDVRRDLHVGDAQIGLLLGPAFGVFYAVLGLPFGWLADKVHRTRLIAGGLLLWTIATMAGGFVHSFPMLAAARMGVGVGEAALVPAAVSLLADAFPSRRRALPLAVFTAGISIGAGLALMLGGSLIAYASNGATALPLIGIWLEGRAPWQVVLVLAGLGGIPLALLIGALPELRRDRAETGEVTGAGLFSYLSDNGRLFAGLLAGTASLYIFSNALAAWLPSLFIRAFGWSPVTVGLRIGGIVLVCSLIGTLSSGALATRAASRGRPAGGLHVMTLGALLLIPTSLVASLAPNAGVAQLGFAAVYFALSLCFGVATTSFVAVTPARLRGRMIALYLMIGNLCGLCLGPPVVGLLLDGILGNAAQVGIALALLAFPTTMIGAFLLRGARHAYGRRAGALGNEGS